MLVLARKTDEVIRIGDDITIMVVKARPEWVQLGITAPRDVPVHREEVYQDIQRENGQDGQPPACPQDDG